jgi:hypothetical protein
MALARLASVRPALAAAARSPLAWILAALFCVRIVGIGWGLPASDGWDVDGVAPRDVLSGLVVTVLPGQFYTYPPVHLFLVAALTAPITIAALAHAPSLAQADVVREVIHVPYMTAIAYVARFVSLGMSLGVVWAIAKMTEEVRGARAGWCAAAFVGTNATLTYYAHTSNLDVPYLFWGSLSILAIVRAIARGEPRRLRRAALFAALAVGTKDQAYALFLLAAPIALASWVLLDPWARAHVRAVLREAAVAVGIAAASLVVLDGVVFNPSGFRARLRFLAGPASQAYAEYTDDWAGRWQVVRGLAARFHLAYPPVFAALVAIGFAVLLVSPRGRARDRARLVASLVPLLVAASYTVAFNCVARRTDARFGLPQSVLIAVYGGVAIDALVFRLRVPTARWIARLAVGASFCAALFVTANVDASLLCDPRYDAEAWMKTHVAPGDVVETYGQNVYLPRFPASARVVRVGPQPADHKNPMPNVEEVLGAYENAAVRAPRFIVVCEGWAWRYLFVDPDAAMAPGRMLAPTQRETSSDAAATSYFRALTTARYPAYHLVHVSEWKSAVWRHFDVHASTSHPVWIYERSDDAP